MLVSIISYKNLIVNYAMMAPMCSLIPRTASVFMFVMIINAHKESVVQIFVEMKRWEDFAVGPRGCHAMKGEVKEDMVPEVHSGVQNLMDYLLTETAPNFGSVPMALHTRGSVLMGPDGVKKLRCAIFHIWSNAKMNNYTYI